LWGTIAGLDRAEPIYPEALERLFGGKPHCKDPDNSDGRIDCDARDFELAGVRVGGLDFRLTPNRGSLLILQPLEGDCLAVDSFDEQFGKGVLTGSCT
jgi:hypothetical protein